MDLIKVENLSFNYPGKKATLEDISFGIEEGTFNCIVGENGSGKSTLLKCILGLNKGYKGKIHKEKNIGYRPQKTEIQSNFPTSIEEVVMSGTINRHIRSIFYKSDDIKKAMDIMTQLGIYHIRKNAFCELSGGQQQRVLIARALCATDKIIVLDEPTTGLDPKIAVQIYEMLSKLRKENNLTILIVSHDIDRALKFSDNVLEIKNGKLTFCGKTKDYEMVGDNNDSSN